MGGLSESALEVANTTSRQYSANCKVHLSELGKRVISHIITTTLVELLVYEIWTDPKG